MIKQEPYTRKRRTAIGVAILLAVVWSMGFYFVGNIITGICYTSARCIKAELSGKKDTLILPVSVWDDAAQVVRIKEHEIRYGGEMFDISRKTIKGDKIILEGHYDSFESDLYTVLFGFFDASGDDVGSDHVRWVTWAAILSDVVICNHCQEMMQEHFSYWQNQLYHFLHTQLMYSPPDSSL